MAYPLSTIKNFKTPAPANSGSSPSSPRQGNQSSQGGQGGSWFRSLVTLLVVVAILAAGLYLAVGYTSIKSWLPGSSLFASEWQAVFLSNDQVYFGHVDNIHPDFIALSDIYYLQVVNVDNASALGQPPDVQAQPEQRLTLIKLGNEIHGPLDSMLINRDHVVIIEDLKSDSRVVQAINDYLTKKTK